MLKKVKFWYQKFSSRERLYINILIFSLLGLIFAIYFFTISLKIAQKKDEIAYAKESFKKIEALYKDYRELMAMNEEAKNKIINNPLISLTIPLNNIAKSIEIPSGSPSVKKYLSDVIRFEGKLKETPLSVDKGTKKKKEKQTDQFILIEQDVTFNNIPVESFFQFLKKLKEFDMLFLTRLDVIKLHSTEYDMLRVSLTVATIKYLSEKEQ